jgi:5-methylcytosine-specific restriction endonuclease McrA
MNGLYSELPEQADFDGNTHRLGRICKRGHDWGGTGQSLRQINGKKCVECSKARQREWYAQNLEEQRRKARERMRAKLQDPEYRKIFNERNRQWMSRHRAENGETLKSGLHIPPHLYGHGLRSSDMQVFIERGFSLEELTLETIAQQQTLWQHIKAMKAGPSVARLVMNEQQHYWKQNPDAKKEHDRQWGRAKWWLEYQTRPELRLYIRQKSKRRKAQMRDSIAIQLTGKQTRARFAEFDHKCAYCGAAGDLHIEHVIPISQGGGHALGNIVPACKDCNFSKRDHEAESWYRRQPFFTEARWRKICRVLGWHRSGVGQLALL